MSFVVLEASNRTGGRINSTEFGDPSVARVHIELGANWVHGSNEKNMIYKLATMVGLDMARVPGSTANL